MQNVQNAIPLADVAAFINFDRRVRRMGKKQRTAYLKELARTRPVLHKAYIAHHTLDVNSNSPAGARRQELNAQNYIIAHYQTLGSGAVMASTEEDALKTSVG